jgi:hypothetical protein
VTGWANSDGTFSLSGGNTLSACGLTLGSATVTVSNSGTSVSGSLQVPGVGSIGVSGWANWDGTFSLTGSNALGSVTVSNSGWSVFGWRGRGSLERAPRRPVTAGVGAQGGRESLRPWRRSRPGFGWRDGVRGRGSILRVRIAAPLQ